jgi:hypothetical protein
MGHERVGVLPRTKAWRDVVHEIGNFDGSEEAISNLASSTIKNVRDRLRHIENDESIKAAFKFLVGLAVAARSHEPEAYLSELGINLPTNPTPLALSVALHKWVNSKSTSAEYRELAAWAASDAIVAWQNKQRSDQLKLFDVPEHPYEIWYKAGDGRGFSEIARLFFAKFTERYLNYFLDREASAQLGNFERRERFSSLVEQHAFETSKITQSFAAGWFNKNAIQRLPSDQEIDGFLNHALGKIRDELTREEGAS